MTKDEIESIKMWMSKVVLAYERGYQDGLEQAKQDFEEQKKNGK